MQELKLISWCDECHRRDKAQRPAVNRYVITVQVVGQRGSPIVRGLDVCEVHNEPIVELKETLVAAGTPVPKEEPAPPTPASAPASDRAGDAETVGQRTCPLCDKALHKWTLVRHLVKVHRCAVPAQPKKCPDCGEGYADARSMIGHRRSIHGYDYVADVAKQRAKGKR